MKFGRACLLLLLLSSLSAGADLSTLSGKRFSGEIISIDVKGIVFRTKEGSTQTFLPTEIISLDVGNPLKDPGMAKYLQVELMDGSLFHCTDFKVKETKSLITLLEGTGNGDTKELPNTSIYYMIRDAYNTKTKLDFITILNESRKQRRDIWVVKKGDRLDALPGTFGNGNFEKNTIDFSRDGGDKPRPISLNQIYGLGFNQINDGAAIPPTICKVIDVNRNVLVAKAINFTEKGVSIATVSGVTIDYPQLSAIHKFDFSTASMRYLSDIEPTQIDETSTDGIIYRYMRDKNLDAEPIRVGGITFGKGLSLHARTGLSYNINSEYKQFRTVIGVDDSWEPDVTVRVTVEADGKELFKKLVKKKDKPAELNLDVRGVKILRLVVESELFDTGNMINFADARVTK